jgi:hypothetical protein
MNKKVIVHLFTQSEPMVFEGVVNTYQKGDLFCVLLEKEHATYKFPLVHVFRIIETREE